MSAAAFMSCPTTSPITSAVDPSAITSASYQSPPTCSRAAAGR